MVIVAGVGFGFVAMGPQTRFFPTVRQNSMVVRVRLGTEGLVRFAGIVMVEGATVTLGLIVDVVVEPVTTGNVVVEGRTGAMTAGVGKLAGQGSTGGSGLAVSSGGQFGPALGEIHWKTCQLTASPTRAPRGQRPGQALFHVTM